jgi:hypothetical protein
MLKNRYKMLEALTALLETASLEDNNISILKKVSFRMLEILETLELKPDYYITIKSMIEARQLILAKKQLMSEKYSKNENVLEDAAKLRSILIEMINLCDN